MVAIPKLKLNAWASQFPHFLKALGLIWQANKRLTLYWAVILIFQGMIPAGTVWVTRSLVDALTTAIGAGVTTDTIKPVVICASVMGAMLLIGNMLQGIMGWVRAAQSEQTADYMSGLIHHKLVNIDLSFYETPENLDRMHQASNNLQTKPLTLLENVGGLIQSSITLVMMGAILVPYGVFLPILLIGASLPSFIMLLKTNKQFHEWWLQSTQNQRWAQYYDYVLKTDMFAAEVRLFGIGEHFKNAYQSIRSILRKERLNLVKRQGLARLWASMLALIIAGGTMGWMVWRAFLGLVTLGDLVLFYQIFNKGQSLLGALLGNVGNLYNNTLFIGKLFEFLEINPSVTDPCTPIKPPAQLNQGIGLKGVTFRYPGSSKAALENFSCWFPAGKVVAIVGTNGAGKTTLMKLLCRFYDPDAGSITFDGHDIRRFAISKLRRMITAIFQFPLMHVATASENISLGDLHGDKSPNAIQMAAKKAGAHEFISKLPHGYDTLLNKYFPNGVNLSGGEQQRLSLARAYKKNSPIVILDEPTSLMDSWAVNDWFNRFRKLALKKTSILITHSLLIASKADLIYVMDSGQIVESGTHEALLLKNGQYAASWNAQFQPAPERRNQNAKPDVRSVKTPYCVKPIGNILRKVS